MVARGEGQKYLNKEIISNTERLLSHLAKELDVGLRNYMKLNYDGNCRGWD